MSYILILLVCTCLELAMASNQITLAFGACFKFYRNHDTDVFKRIGEFNPNTFVWLGDAAYIDYMPIIGYWFPELNETRIEEKFNITKLDKYYSQFTQQYQIKGVYDDHDSNENNGGRHNPHKEMSKQKYLDFIGESKNSPLRAQNGIYQSFYLDTHQKIQVILADVRYEADEHTGDTLGEEQWEWLEKQLQKQAELTILGSGVQVMPDDRFGPETWFQKSKQRLYSLIQKYHSTIIFISGDVHYSEILQHPCPLRFGQDIFEFTSSGLSFANADHIPFVDFIFQFLFPATFSTQDKHYYSSNFGILKIDVSETGSPLKVIFETHSSVDSSVKLRQEIQISELKYNPNRVDQESQCILDIPAEQRYHNSLIVTIKKNWLELSIVGVAIVSVLLGLVMYSIRWWRIVYKLYLGI